jgi:N-acetylglucosamine-6-sulfatase
VPLILRGPGVPAGVQRGQIVSNVDLAPTILDAAGARGGQWMDGISLLPLARDPRVARSRAILLEGGPDGPAPFAGVRAPGWAYLEHGPDAEELYDMASDPFQLESLHSEPRHRGRKLELATLLRSMGSCAGRSCYQELPAE